MSPTQQGTLAAQAAANNMTLSPGQNVDMNAFLGGIKDAVTGNYYSTIKLAAGQLLLAQYNFFAAGLQSPDPYPLPTITGAAPALTKVETNIQIAANNGLQPPYDIIIDSIGLYFHPLLTIMLDAAILTLYSYFEFQILGKVQWDGKLESYPAGMGFSGFTTRTAESGWQSGLPEPGCRKRFGPFGKYLSPNLAFSLPLYFPPTSGPVAGTYPPVQTASAGVPSAATLTAANATPTAGQGTQLRAHMFGILGRPVT